MTQVLPEGVGLHHGDLAPVSRPHHEGEGVAVTPDDHVDPADALGDEPVHREARVAQSHDVAHAELDQLVHLLLHRRDLVQEPQGRKEAPKVAASAASARMLALSSGNWTCSMKGFRRPATPLSNSWFPKT
ncbi:hypothetical protein EYF80_045025 [Liparis tanakae]|uniref:Uncharacterized protein n=1 Tax=Liparis tanakae TaxID=230148 RepID=A0A4Z2FU81_9TELE|nr:hypothetical protein EYF80_045025 [Liparis tanakae]